jgi:hypothetical protein
VVAPAGQHEALFQQQLELDIGLRAADEVDAEIGFAARHGRQHLVGAGVEDAHPDVRIGRVVALDHLRQEVEAVDGTQAIVTSPMRVAATSWMPSSVLSRSSSSWRVLRAKSRPTAVSSTRRVLRSSSARPARLQLVDAAAEGRLRDVHRLGRAPEVAGLGDRREGLQVAQVEVDRHR